MRLELERLLDESGQKQSKISRSAAEMVHAVLMECRPLSWERDLINMNVRISEAAKHFKEALFDDSNPVWFSSEQATGEGKAYTDGVFWQRDRESLVLWATKSPNAGEKYMDRLVSSGSVSFAPSHTRWEHEHAILARVRLIFNTYTFTDKRFS